MRDFQFWTTYAEAMVEFHLDLPPWSSSVQSKVYPKEKRYEVFYKNFNTLKEGKLDSYTNKQLDCYLWLTGLYKTWFQKGSINNKEIDQLFSALTIERVPQPPLSVMLPQGLI
jgi:hypothetical protein